MPVKIEDFEDTTLISGPTISFDGTIPENKSYTTLPNTFDTNAEPQTANNFWDGWRGGVELRNAYLLIEGTDGELISSVRFFSQPQA